MPVRAVEVAPAAAPDPFVVTLGRRAEIEREAWAAGGDVARAREALDAVR